MEDPRITGTSSAVLERQSPTEAHSAEVTTATVCNQVLEDLSRWLGCDPATASLQSQVSFLDPKELASKPCWEELSVNLGLSGPSTAFERLLRESTVGMAAREERFHSYQVGRTEERCGGPTFLSSGSGSTELWELTSGTVIKSLPSTGYGGWKQIGHYLCNVELFKAVHVYDVETDSLKSFPLKDKWAESVDIELHPLEEQGVLLLDKIKNRPGGQFMALSLLDGRLLYAQRHMTGGCRCVAGDSYIAQYRYQGEFRIFSTKTGREISEEFKLPMMVLAAATKKDRLYVMGRLDNSLEGALVTYELSHVGAMQIECIKSPEIEEIALKHHNKGGFMPPTAVRLLVQGNYAVLFNEGWEAENLFLNLLTGETVKTTPGTKSFSAQTCGIRGSLVYGVDAEPRRNRPRTFLTLWDLRTGEEIAKWLTGFVGFFGFINDEFLVTRGQNGTIVRHYGNSSALSTWPEVTKTKQP